MTDRNEQATPNAANSKPAELDETALDDAAGGKHPAKVTVPDIKLGISYQDHQDW